ncbi:Symplekin [Nymphon striatum]|nr:Symplekin [Nymphon striatum]
MSVDISSRLSTAAQFFLDDETPEPPSKSTHETVVELLNSAALATSDSGKVSTLKKVQELIIHKEPNLLDNFLDEMLAFQSDKGTEVKKFIVGFIEAACKLDNEVLPKVMANLRMMLSDEAVAVQKRVIQAATQIYKVVLKWLFTEKTITSIMESTWVYMMQIKTDILMMLDSNNDGIRTNAIKFMEALVLVQTYPVSTIFNNISINIHDIPSGMKNEIQLSDVVNKNSEMSNALRATESDTDTSKKPMNEVSIEDIPSDFALFSEEEMETEAKQIFDSLVVFHGSPHISSVNLMACMGSICVIAKQRPELFMSKVVQALEALHVNLPPTLAKSQVSSVRKSLKMHLFSLLKSPASLDFHVLISTLLTDLGATQQELSKYNIKFDEIKKRPKPIDSQPATKKLKTEPTDNTNESQDRRAMAKMAHNTAIDITAEKLYPALHPENVTYAVMDSMHKLPTVMPPHFQASYTPIAAAGTEGQKRHLARLIATQLTAAGLGPGVTEMAKVSEEQAKAAALAAKHIEENTPKTIQTIVGGHTTKKQQENDKLVLLLPTGISTKSKRIGMKQLDLKSLTNPLSPGDLQTMTHSAIYRILKAEGLFSIASYGSECWVLKTSDKKKIDAFEVWCYRRLLRISWTERKTNEWVLDKIGNPESLRTKLSRRKMSFVGHIFRSNDIDKELLMGTAYGNRGRGRPKTRFSDNIKEIGGGRILVSFILEDIRNRIDLAFSWLYEEYVVYHGFTSISIRREKSLAQYDRCFNKLVQGLIYKTEAKEQEMIFTRLLLEAPCLTESAVQVIKEFCEREEHVGLGLATLKELVVRRPSLQEDFICIVLQLTTHEKSDIRAKSLELAQQLHKREELKSIIEEHALKFLKHLLEPEPPIKELNPSIAKNYAVDQKWSEEIARLFLQLYLALLPGNHKLIHDLGTVYVTAAADLKRTILRILETPVKGMGMDSPELLLLVENCPKGAETLVTRIIHILTDKAPPSSALVARVRDLYHKRVPDVRFLIPVLNGLTKKEVIAALPKLIKLNPVVFKEVFNRLLGGHGM